MDALESNPDVLSDSSFSLFYKVYLGDGDQPDTSWKLVLGREDSKRVKIPSRGFWTFWVRLTWLAWGVHYWRQ